MSAADRLRARAEALGVLAEFGTPPATDLGRVLVAWLGGDACGACRGESRFACRACGATTDDFFKWVGCDTCRGANMSLRECCAGKGTACAALLEQVAS